MPKVKVKKRIKKSIKIKTGNRKKIKAA